MYMQNMVEKQLILVDGSYLYNFLRLKKNMKQYVTKAGLFDVSHMGEIFVEGADALSIFTKAIDE